MPVLLTIIYQFDDQQHLKVFRHARAAYYHQSVWILKEVEKLTFLPDQVIRDHLVEDRWQAVLSPQLVKIVVIFAAE